MKCRYEWAFQALLSMRTEFGQKATVLSNRQKAYCLEPFQLGVASHYLPNT